MKNMAASPVIISVLWEVHALPVARSQIQSVLGHGLEQGPSNSISLIEEHSRIYLKLQHPRRFAAAVAALSLHCDSGDL